jgi:hypothetical protein
MKFMLQNYVDFLQFNDQFMHKFDLCFDYYLEKTHSFT